MPFAFMLTPCVCMQALALTVLTAGGLGVALAALERTFRVVKEVSKVVEAAEAQLSLRHHHSRVGYQQEVRALCLCRVYCVLQSSTALR